VKLSLMNQQSIISNNQGLPFSQKLLFFIVFINTTHEILYSSFRKTFNFRKITDGVWHYVSGLANSVLSKNRVKSVLFISLIYHFNGSRWRLLRGWSITVYSETTGRVWEIRIDS
jgi:hypothetical protein